MRDAPLLEGASAMDQVLEDEGAFDEDGLGAGAEDTSPDLSDEDFDGPTLDDLPAVTEGSSPIPAGAVSTSPDRLYSPLTGAAFEAGSPEYEEGYGPMGEELVATPPSGEMIAESQDLDGEMRDMDRDLDRDLPPERDDVYQDIVSEQNEQQRLEAARAQQAAAEAVAANASAPSAVPEQPEQPAPSAPEGLHAAGPNPEVQLPTPGPYAKPATLTLYHQRQPVLEVEIDTDETLIGRQDIRADIHPDIDLTQWDPETFVSRKHAYVYRQNKNYTLYAVSNGGLQLNSDMLELGDRRPLKHGDVIVVAGILAFKFALPTED